MTSSRILMAIALCLVALGLSTTASMSATMSVEPLNTGTVLYLPIQCAGDCSGRYYANRLRAIELANIERAKVGCPAALIADGLMRATQDWSYYMDSNRDFRHALSTHYTQYGYPQGVLENIGLLGLPDQFIEAILASPHHKRNMLYCDYSIPGNPEYNPDVYYEIGVGESNGYWVMGIIPIRPAP